MVNVLVTGGAGFVGSHVASALRRLHGEAGVARRMNVQRMFGEAEVKGKRAMGEPVIERLILKLWDSTLYRPTDLPSWWYGS